MTSINNYSYPNLNEYDESDCETYYSNEEEENNNEYIEEEYQEEEYNEYDNEDYYYENPKENYISVKEISKDELSFSKINTSIPKVNPWGLKLNDVKDEKTKTFEDIIKEEEEHKIKEEKKKNELEKVNKKRKERFSNSRQKFHFRQNNNTEKRSSLLLNMKSKN